MILGALRRRHSAPVVVIVGVVLAANALYLFGVFDPNPINLYSQLAAITHSGWWPGLPEADPNAGITAQTLGHLVAEDWLGGHIPWWNPFEGLGAPLAGEMQSGGLFPPNLLLVFSNGQVYLHALLELIAGLSTYALLAEMRLGRLAATTGGVVFALCGTFAWFSHAPANPICFLPVVLWGVERTAANRRGGPVLIGVGLALSLYAGFPETAYIDGLLAAAWALARLVTSAPEQRRRFVLALAAGSGLGLLLAAPILVAFVDYLPASELGGHNAFGNVHLPALAAPQMVLPYIYGPVDAFSSHSVTLTDLWGNVGGYLSLPLVVLGTVGAFSRRHRVLCIVLVLFLVVALGRSFGIPGPQQLVNLLPGMKTVAFYRYSQATWVMAALALACIGLDELVQHQVSRRRMLAAGGVGLAVVAASVLESRSLLHQLDGLANHWAWASLGWALFVVVTLTAGALLLKGRRRAVLLAVVVIVDALAMFVVPQGSAPRAVAIYLAPTRYLAAHLGSSRFYSVAPIAPDYGSYFGLSSLAMRDLPEPKHYVSFVATQLGIEPGPSLAPLPAVTNFLEHLPQFEQAGVKYLLTPGDFVLPKLPATPSLALVFSGPSADIWLLPHPGGLYTTTSGGCRVSQQELESVVASCHSSGHLVRRELDMRGWSVTVNGKSAHIVSDGVFQQVALPRGDSHVKFVFMPPYMTLALAAFVLGLALAVIGSRRTA
jgi:hypothetical protein